jgi:F-type H+-transporting ATPase subunit delta
MKITKQTRRDANALFRSSHQEGQLNEDKVRQACKVVLEKKPRSYIAILSHLQHLVKLDIQNRTARIESAVALDDGTQNAITQNLSQRYGNQLITEFSVNPSLVGGVRIQVGSDVFDGSIRSRLQTLEGSFGQS